MKGFARHLCLGLGFALLIAPARADPVEIEVKAEIVNITDLFDVVVQRTANFGRIYQSPLTDCQYNINARGDAMTIVDVAAGTTRTTPGGTKNGCRFTGSNSLQSASVYFTCLAGTTIVFDISTDSNPADTVSLRGPFALDIQTDLGAATADGVGATLVCPGSSDGNATVLIGPKLYVRAGTSAPAGVWTGNLLVTTNF
jgi:hypothetical protein